MFKCLVVWAIVVSLLNVQINAGEFITTEEGNTFYVQKEPRVTWYDAIRICASQNMSLITPDTEKKQLEINKVVKATKVEYAWTAAHEVDELRFVWITTGENLTYTNWRQGEPYRDGAKPQSIGIYEYKWRSYKYYDLRSPICEEHPLGKDNISKVSSKLADQIANMINRNEVKQVSNTSTLLEKSHEINALKLENEKHLNQMIMANKSLELKSLEIEMLKKNHDEEMQLLEEKHNYAMRTLQLSCDYIANRTSVNKNFNFIFHGQGGRN